MRFAFWLAALPITRAQHYGKQTQEVGNIDMRNQEPTPMCKCPTDVPQMCILPLQVHLPMPVKQCTKSTGCTTQESKVVLDSNWRWTHKVGTTDNCFTGNDWNKTYCQDVQSCTSNCAIDGIDQKEWNGTYGIHASNGAVNLSFVTQGPYSKNVGSRLYLLEDDQKYQIFKL